MRKLLYCVLGASLLLTSCDEEVGGIARILPEVTLDEFVSVSEVPYDELETLFPTDANVLEEMRRNGGLVARTSVNMTKNYEGYDFLEVNYSDIQSALPSGNMSGSSIWSELSGSQTSYDGNTNIYIFYGEYELSQLSGKTIYCKAAVGMYGDSRLPGFMYDCMADSYGNTRKYSNVLSYTYPDAPQLIGFDVSSGDAIQAWFRVITSQTRVGGRPDCGLCYSMTNQLPALETDASVSASVVNDVGDGTYQAMATLQAPAGLYYVRAFARQENGTVAYSPVQRASCQGLMASVRIDSLRYIADIPYNALARYTLIDDENYLNDLRIRGGALIFESASIEGDVYTWDMGLSVSATGASSLPTEGYDNGYGAEPLWKNEDDANNLWMLYWQPASYFAYDRERNDFHYQAAIGVSGASGNTIWSYSDVLATVWEEEPVIETVYYYGGNPLTVSMDLTTWGHSTQTGVCYSTTNDLPTLEQCDGVAQCPDTSLGYGVNSYYEFTLPAAGTYYVRAYAQSEGGLTYSPVQQVTITGE